MVTESVTIAAHQRKKIKGTRKIPADLPRAEVPHDIAEGEKFCPHDGTALVRIAEETSEQFEFIPAKMQVLKHVRYKYGCPCCRQGVKIAPVPPHILPKSKASPSLLAHIVTAKYVDALPLHRQEAQFARLGVDLPRATMASWMVKLGECVVPIINLMNEQLLARGNRQGQLPRAARLPLPSLRGTFQSHCPRTLRGAAALEHKSRPHPSRLRTLKNAERRHSTSVCDVLR